MKWMCEHWIVILSAVLGEPDHLNYRPRKDCAFGQFVDDCLCLPFGIAACLYGFIAALKKPRKHLWE